MPNVISIHVCKEVTVLAESEDDLYTNGRNYYVYQVTGKINKK